MHDTWNDRLSEYLDGELEPRERAAIETHLAGCVECRTDLADLRAVVARAQSLTDTAPIANLWPGVEARIAAPAARHAETGQRAASRSRCRSSSPPAWR